MSIDTARGLWFPRPVRAWLGPLRRTLRAAGFWLAVALPLVYVPLLVVWPAAAGHATVLPAVLATNLIALAVGHGHEPSLGRFARED